MYTCYMLLCDLTKRNKIYTTLKHTNAFFKFSVDMRQILELSLLFPRIAFFVDYY